MKTVLFYTLCAPLLGQTFIDPHYTADLVIGHPNGITCIEFDSTGRLWAGEKQGRLLVFEPDGTGGFLAPTVFADYTSIVNPDLEAGLLGLEIDEHFATTRHLYIFISTDTDQRVLKITANATFTGVESDEVLIQGFPRQADNHKGGCIIKDPNNPSALLIALGDDDGWGISHVQDIDQYYGKILRVSTDTGQGIPSNPFWNGNPDAIRSKVWAVGFRNPFRITFFPSGAVPDVIYNSENGDSTDRLSWAEMGSNGAWGPAGDGGGFLNPPTWMGKDHLVMETDNPSVIGIAIATSGPFAPSGPTLYWANWLSGIHRYELSGADFNVATAMDGGSQFTDITAMDLKFGPDGNLYSCASGGDASTGGWYPIWQIRFEGVDPPIAGFTTNPSPASGDAPLMVTFTDTSTAPGSNIASWEWDFGDGNTSTVQNPTHTFTDPGQYTVSLTVRNDEGLQDTATTPVAAHQTFTIDFTGTVFDGRTLPAQPLSGTTQLRFYQTNGSPIPISGGVGPEANGIEITNGIISDTVALDVTGDMFLVSAGEPAGDGVHQATVAVDPNGDGIGIGLAFYLSDLMIRGRVRTLWLNPAEIDIGLAFQNAGNWIDVAGGRDYLGGSGITPSGFDHRRVTDALGYFHFAIPSGTGTGNYILDLVADTNANLYGSHQETHALSTELELDLFVGQFAGGQSCTDLSGEPVTPNVNFSVIQDLFSANCTACHNATATNSGGLNLLPGSAEGELVDQYSAFVPGVKLVEPGFPNQSFLMEKINCLEPQYGTVMRPTGPMTNAERALVRDWITQLNQPCLAPFLANLPNWPSQSVLNFVPLACP